MVCIVLAHLNLPTSSGTFHVTVAVHVAQLYCVAATTAIEKFPALASNMAGVLG